MNAIQIRSLESYFVIIRFVKIKYNKKYRKCNCNCGTIVSKVKQKTIKIYFYPVINLVSVIKLLFDQLKLMNRQTKQLMVNFDKKLEFCSDELSLLLDLIYKFPQQQRERFYQRIQLIKQSIVSLKITIKENCSMAGLNLSQKKYQQIFLKINQLKGEIGSYESNGLNKKKKSLHYNENSNIFEQSAMNTGYLNKQKKTFDKVEYESIMDTIVKKQEEIKKYKQKVEELSQIVKQQELNEQNRKVLISELQKELREICSINESHFRKIQKLENEAEERTIKCEELEEINNLQRDSLEQLQREFEKLTIILDQTSRNFQEKKVQAEGYAATLAAFQEKYRYQIKSHTDRQESARVKQKNYERKIKDIERELEVRLDIDEKNKQLLLQNLRLKEDLKVLENEITVKQEQLFEKNKKIQSYKIQVFELNEKLQQLHRNSAIIQQELKDKTRVEDSSKQTISILERRIKELQCRTAQMQQQKLMSNKKVRQLQFCVQELNKKVVERGEQFRKCNDSFHSLEKRSQQLEGQRQNLKRQIDRCSIELAMKDSKIEELSRIASKAQSQRNLAYQKLELSERKMMQKQESCSRHEKQITNLKVRILKAKIECIHNIRQIIV